MAAPLTRDAVTPASRQTIPFYVLTSAVFGLAIFATELRDDGNGGMPATLLWVQAHCYLHIWWIGAAFEFVAACMVVALLQHDRTAHVWILGLYIFWLTLLGLLLEAAPFAGTGSFLAGLPFLALAYLVRVTQRSVAREDHVGGRP